MVARIAYDQIVANHMDEHGAETAIPAKLLPDNHIRFASVLRSAGVEIALLEKAGVITVKREEVHNCGMTNYSRTDEYYTVDMLKLNQLASEAMPAPQAPPARPRVAWKP
jgi:hypothetical protein